MKKILYQFGIILVCLTAPVYAQEDILERKLLSKLNITVKDPDGQLVNASVQLENLSTGQILKPTGTAHGRFSFDSLSYDRYKLRIVQEGFTNQSFLIDVNSNLTINKTIKLTIGALSYNQTVIDSALLPGVNLKPEEMPASVQIITNTDLLKDGSVPLSEFLNRRVSGVTINETQGNQFQSDLNYRGYTISPLLGTPQGLSVYLDGLRMNQPFGDVVSWDLIPRIALSEVTLISGSNSLYGLNTLGGTILLNTKDGYSFPGTSLLLRSGSFGQKLAEAEYGGFSNSGIGWYFGGSLFFEDGWRKESPSNVRQLFSKFTWNLKNTSVGVTLGHANNQFTGNGLQTQEMIEKQYNSVYTKPDITSNYAPYTYLTVRHAFNHRSVFLANVFSRYIRTNTFNADINEDSLEENLYQPDEEEKEALHAAGYSGFPTSEENAGNTPFPYWRCLANVLLREEPSEKCNGLLNRASTRQRNFGFSANYTHTSFLSDSLRNQITAGIIFNYGNTNFLQSTELGYLNPDKSVTGLAAFGDGISGGKVDGIPFDTRVNLFGVTHTESFFISDTFKPARQLLLNFSGRFDRTVINNSDRITPEWDVGSLDGYHIFNRINPAIGASYNLKESVNLYINYTQGSRAPTSIELGCADPNHPCKLPNAMASDPPLKQVLTRSFEIGLKGGKEGKFSWSVNSFRTYNLLDILFVASKQTGYGYFKNFGKTKRQGLSFDVNTAINRIGITGNYTFLDATFQSKETVDGSSNSTNEQALENIKGVEGVIGINPGNKIPLIPQHIFKAFFDYQATKKLSLNLGIIGISSSYARGNENNLHKPDGVYYLGSGKSPGYTVTNLNGRYRLFERLQLFIKINNLFNQRYYTSAQLGPNGFTNDGNFIARPFEPVDDEYPIRHSTFLAPGAPRGVWGGMRIAF